MLGKARLQTFFDIAIVAETADGNSRDAAYGTQLHHQVHAGAVWQRNIANEKIELIADGGLHGRAHVMRGCDEMTTPNEQSLQGGAGVPVVVHQ